ncbi:MAG TPA: DUF5916 domain-containing protein [Chitinophagaceae bacterium]|nr:DUF5916 domain-containing protein [Chitinophagaceae bacterium]
MLKIILNFLPVVAFATMAQAQTSPVKELKAKRTIATIKVDGLINEPEWKEAPAALGYTEFRPTPHRKEEDANRTEAFILYNNEGIYIGGFNYERTKDSIATELKGRDGFGTNDFIGIIFDTYKDHLNGFEYFVTPLGEQWDAKVAPNNNGNEEDFSWNAVWQSAAVIHQNGWSYEIFIPYSAIRFSSKQVQDWGMNITRRRQKTGQQVTWNPIDVNKNGFLTQEGYLKGLENIKPPLRLQFSPYFSIYQNHYPLNQPGKSNWINQINGGVDVKYGINQAFTLDMTLIPDFGQVQSDNQVLNLTPFEVRFNENRSFFTEGTELFGKGGLFYSRRIGGQPLHYWDAQNNNATKNPSESKLINATKISGRTHNGLGIGVLNAITQTQHATIEDASTKEQYKYETNPLTNYNVLTLDQTLKNNSSISLINTNVWRSGKDYDANVTAFLFDLNDKKNSWNVGGKFANSNLIGINGDGKNISGYNHNLYFGKTSGFVRFNISQELADKKYNHSDLGYFTNNNYIDQYFWTGLLWTKPKGWHNRLNLNFNFWYSRLFSKFEGVDNLYQRSGLNINANAQTKKLSFVGVYINYNFKENDFYEPRASGTFFKRGASIGGGGWFNSNEAKRYSYSAEGSVRKTINFYNGWNMNLSLGHNFRFNNKFSISHRISFEPRFNNVGFATFDNNNKPIFGKRDRNTIENTLNLKYNFNNKTGITFRARHYWSKVKNKELFDLNADGTLAKNNIFTGNADRNVNFFNIDMVYTWQFAPGSFINIVWKNSIVDFRDQVERSYFKNLRNTFDADQNNNLSLRVIYFLDYLQLRKKKR